MFKTHRQVSIVSRYPIPGRCLLKRNPASLAVVGEVLPLELDVLASKAWSLSFKEIKLSSLMKEWMSFHKLGMLIFT